MNKQILRSIIFVGLFALPFIPFLVSSSFFFPFITAKAFAWRIIIEVVFATWVLLAFLDQSHRPKKSPIVYAVLSFLVIIGLADAFGVSPTESFWSSFERMEGYITLLHLGAFFLVIGSVFKEHDWRRWWNTTLVASFIMVLYAIFQLAGSVAIHQGGVRVDGTLGNATYLAVYMLFHIFIAAIFLWRERASVTMRWLYGLLILGQVVVLYHTATRGAILGLLGGMLIVALLNIRNKTDRSVRRASIGILLALVFVVGGFALLRNSSFVETSPVLSRFASISTQELKSGGRSFVWPMAFEGFKERPLLGWGQENFTYIFQKHYKPEMYSLEPWFDRAHNIFLDWMVVGGIPGILAYLALYAAILHLLWRRDNKFSHVEKSILTGLLAAYFFHNFFVFDHLISYILFFSLLAYAHSQSGDDYMWKKVISETKIKRIGLPLVLILAVLALYFVNVKPIIANTRLIEALKSIHLGEFEKAGEYFAKSHNASLLGRAEVAQHMAANSVAILESNLASEKKSEFYNFAKEAVTKEAENLSQNARQQLVTGSFLTSTGFPDEALVYLKRAQELAPGKQQTYIDIGSAYFSKNEPALGLAAFKQAYDLAPQFPEARLIYFIGAIYANNRVVESSLITLIEENHLVFDDRIINAYYARSRFAEVIQLLQERKRIDPANAASYDEFIKQVQGRL